MKKFLSVIVLTLAIIFASGSNNFVSTQEVYAGNVNYVSFYVDTNSISLENSMSFYVYVKKYDDRSGRLYETNRWKFYVNRGRGSSWWGFDYYLTGTNTPISSNTIARNILRICQQYDSRVFRPR